MKSRWLGSTLVLVGAASLVAASCGGSSSSTRSGGATGGDGGATAGDTGCPTGSETCSCYGNGTCDPGLECLSNVCVSPGTAGSGGTSGSAGTGGSTGGTGGSGGSGGVTGGAGGSGGSSGSSGSGGSGGQPSSGGDAGSGGDTTTEPAGATLLETVEPTFGPYSEEVINFGNGLAQHAGSLYLVTMFDELLRISTATAEVEPGFPVTLAYPNGPLRTTSGVVVDPNDSSIWVNDLNGELHHFDSSFMHTGTTVSFDTEPQLLNLTLHDDTLYVAYSPSNSTNLEIHRINRLTAARGDVTILPDLLEDNGAFYLDLQVYDGQLYVATNFPGFLRMDLDGTNQELVNVAGGYAEEKFYGVYPTADGIYLVSAGQRLIVVNRDGQVQNEWPLQGPPGWQGSYADIELADGKIFVMSQNPMSGTMLPHLLVYEEL